MNRLLPALTLLLLLSSTALHAQRRPQGVERAAELAISNQALQLRYLTDAQVIGRGDNDVAYGFLLTEERDVVGSAELMIDTEMRLLPRLTIQVGPQVYAALLSEENEDVFTFAFGAVARYEIGRSRGIAISGHAFYAPDVLTFGSADNLTDFELRGEIRFTERLIGFAGYRWFELNLVGPEDRDLQTQFFAGVTFPLK